VIETSAIATSVSGSKSAWIDIAQLSPPKRARPAHQRSNPRPLVTSKISRPPGFSTGATNWNRRTIAPGSVRWLIVS
jgi:hypothetical protein